MAKTACTHFIFNSAAVECSICVSAFKCDIRYNILICNHFGLNRDIICQPCRPCSRKNIVVGETTFGKFKVAWGIEVLLHSCTQQTWMSWCDSH